MGAVKGAVWSLETGETTVWTAGLSVEPVAVGVKLEFDKVVIPGVGEEMGGDFLILMIDGFCLFPGLTFDFEALYAGGIISMP